MNPRLVAWIAALLPIAAGHVAYLIAARSGQVPWCFPYVEGCTSISRAARHGVANYWFKATMLPEALVLGLFWWLAYGWLRQVRADAPRRAQAVLWLGWVAAAFLALYVVFLGIEGPVYQWLRRHGIIMTFSLTVLAQMLLTSMIARDLLVPRRVRHAMTAFCGALLGLGLLSLPLQLHAADRDAALDAVEWCYALLMNLFYLLVAWAWSATGYVRAPASGDSQSAARAQSS